MTSESFDDGWCEPRRDERGRYLKGATGNRNGRPPKVRMPRQTLSQLIAKELATEVGVNNHGKTQLVSLREMLIKSLTRSALKAKPKEQLFIVERLEFLADCGEETELPREDEFDEADLRFLENLEREQWAQPCDHCGKSPSTE